MLIYNKGNKNIQVSMKGITCESSKDDNHSISYIVNAPEIICNNKSDAEYIHEELNRTIMSIIRELLYEKGEKND